jgi:hypothetical protein
VAKYDTYVLLPILWSRHAEPFQQRFEFPTKPKLLIVDRAGAIQVLFRKRIFLGDLPVVVLQGKPMELVALRFAIQARNVDCRSASRLVKAKDDTACPLTAVPFLRYPLVSRGALRPPPRSPARRTHLPSPRPQRRGTRRPD